MSDYRAIAGVTGSLQQFLHGPLTSAVPGTTVRTGPPSASLLTGSTAAVNVFLYQVNPNPSWRNAELPVRRGDGSVVRRPQAALDLFYLLSFYGEESKMVPQLLLGAAVSALHARPNLELDSIPEFLDGKSLKNCGLAEQAEVIKFTLIPLSHEELSRLWSVFFQVPYTLSVAYQCSVVLVEADLTPEPALPVLATHLRAGAWSMPRLDSIEPQVVEAAAGAVVRLEGQDLASARVTVRIGEIETVPQTVSADALEVALPVGLRAGPRPVRVAHAREDGDGVTPEVSTESNPLWLVVLPRIVGEPSVSAAPAAAEGAPGVDIHVRVAPEVEPGQAVELLLNEMPAPGRRPRSYRLRAGAEARVGRRLGFPAAQVEPGTYLTRIAVDGVASRLETDGEAASPDFGKFIGPRTTIS